MAIPNRSPLKNLEKMERGRIQGLSKFFGYPPIISETGKATKFKFGEATEFKFGEYIYGANPNKNP